MAELASKLKTVDAWSRRAEAADLRLGTTEDIAEALQKKVISRLTRSTTWKLIHELGASR